MTIREMEDLGITMKIPTKNDAKQFVFMVITLPVITCGCETYEEFRKLLKHDFVEETIDFAQKFDTKLLYTVIDNTLDELGVFIAYDYKSMLKYWKRHNINLDNIPNKVFNVNGTFYRYNSDTGEFDIVKGEDERC